MENVKDIFYAGLGLAKKTEDTVKESFDVLVAKGKRVDAKGNNLIKKYFNLVEKTAEEHKTKINEKLVDHLDKVEEFIVKVKSDIK
jgi:polyhydroxyalkanoate synthesis regulator phasin